MSTGHDALQKQEHAREALSGIVSVGYPIGSPMG